MPTAWLGTRSRIRSQRLLSRFRRIETVGQTFIRPADFNARDSSSRTHKPVEDDAEVTQ